MARILVAWELGSGLGHLSRLQPIVAGLIGRGHSVDLIVKDLASAARLLSDGMCTYSQSPGKLGPASRPKHPPRSLAHILHNCGWEDLTELRALVGAWRHLLTSHRPDAIVFDHCPTGLLASQGMDVSRVVIGTGFCCPPDHSPLMDLRPWMPPDDAALASDEGAVLSRANTLLVERKQPPLDRITRLYADVDRVILGTFPELDHYGEKRGNAAYHGVWSIEGGDAPPWPARDGPRIFAYLKPFRELDFLLETLDGVKAPTLIFAPQVAPTTRERFASPSLGFLDRPVDTLRTCREADIVIHHGGHGMTASTLFAGKPSVIIPFHLEQTLTALRMDQLGAAAVAQPERRDQIAGGLRALFTDMRHKRNAQQFAERYANYNSSAAVRQVVDTIESLA